MYAGRLPFSGLRQWHYVTYFLSCGRFSTGARNMSVAKTMSLQICDFLGFTSFADQVADAVSCAFIAEWSQEFLQEQNVR